MMSQRFNLFYAGYTAYLPSLYFGELAFLNSCEQEETETLRLCANSRLKICVHDEPENVSHVKTAMSIANHFKVETLPMPTGHKDYFEWLSHYTDTFEKQFPMSRIDHYYFLYARKVAEIMCNSGLTRMYVDVTLDINRQHDFTPKIEKCLKDSEYILFKLMAAAALLSSEPRQNYFNVYYREICNEFAVFKELNVAQMGDKELKDLNSSLLAFETSVTNGFKKCIALLKDLAI